MEIQAEKKEVKEGKVEKGSESFLGKFLVGVNICLRSEVSRIMPIISPMDFERRISHKIPRASAGLIQFIYF